MKKIIALFAIFLVTPFCVTSCNAKEKNPFLTYDTIEVNYQLPKIENFNPDLLKITSSDTTLFTVKEEVKNKNKVVLDSNLKNKKGKADLLFTYNNELLKYKIPLTVRAPKNLQEAFDAVTLAAIKLPAKTIFPVTFNFSNKTGFDVFDKSLEIYGRREIIGYQYRKGKNITNNFVVDTDADFAKYGSTMEKGDDEYCDNICSLNFLSRKNKNQTCNDDFYIDHVDRTLNIKNSEELFWSVEHGYKPIIDSSALGTVQDIYEAAKLFCSSVNDNWSDLAKFRYIYDRLNIRTYYDFSAISYKGDWFNKKAYFLEGVFLDEGRAVCDGFSKAYALLCGILGLPCFRSYGFNDRENSGHAWDYVKLDNKWYLVCPTWVKIQDFKDEPETDVPDFYNESIALPNYSSFLASKNYFKNLGSNFTDLAFPNIKRSNARYPKLIDEIDYHVTSESTAFAIAKKVSDSTIEPYKKICVYLTFDIDESKDNVKNWSNTIAEMIILKHPLYQDYVQCFATIENQLISWICFKLI